MKDTISRYSTGLALELLERLIRAKITVTGEKNLDAGPTLFAINHFTRAETFLIPHVILKKSGRYVRTLADDALFVGRFGDYLRRLGVMSTREAHRDEKIIGDLMTGRQSWAIYPEGVMVKSKRLIRRGRFRLARSGRIGAPKTGAAMLALKAEIYKKRYARAVVAGDAERVEELGRRFAIRSTEELAPKETVVVPVTITYYPLRPGDNAIKTLVKRFAREIPPRLEEELEVEGNLLLSDSDIHIHFGDPIRLTGFVTRHFFFSRWIPTFLRTLEKSNLLLRHEARRLTRRFMKAIYSNLCINIDHLFCSGFRLVGSGKVDVLHFHRAVYATAKEIGRGGKHFLHPTLRKNLVRLLSNPDYRPAASILRLAGESRIVRREGDTYRINKLQLEMMHMFHNVRLKNPMVVIANELEPQKEVIRLLSSRLDSTPAKLREETAAILTREDLDLFEADYEKFREEGVSRGRDVGRPFLLRGDSNRPGIVLSHGFLAAPEEVRLLAELLHEEGYTVYAVRLEGHGTSPADLARVKWRAWYRSYLRGFETLRCCCDRVILGGFSTGGVVAMLAAARLRGAAGVFAISAPYDLGDIRARLVPAVHFWNELVGRFRMEKGRIEFVDNHPENPDINYHRIPVRGLRQLEKLMVKCRGELEHLRVPVLLMHGTDDPAVNPASSKKYFDAIASAKKRILPFECDRHVIVRHEARHAIAREIDRFVKGTCADSLRSGSIGADRI